MRFVFRLLSFSFLSFFLLFGSTFRAEASFEITACSDSHYEKTLNVTEYAARWRMYAPYDMTVEAVTMYFSVPNVGRNTQYHVYLTDVTTTEYIDSDTQTINGAWSGTNPMTFNYDVGDQFLIEEGHQLEFYIAYVGGSTDVGVVYADADNDDCYSDLADPFTGQYWNGSGYSDLSGTAPLFTGTVDISEEPPFESSISISYPDSVTLSSQPFYVTGTAELESDSYVYLEFQNLDKSYSVARWFNDVHFDALTSSNFNYQGIFLPESGSWQVRAHALKLADNTEIAVSAWKQFDIATYGYYDIISPALINPTSTLNYASYVPEFLQTMGISTPTAVWINFTGFIDRIFRPIRGALSMTYASTALDLDTASTTGRDLASSTVHLLAYPLFFFDLLPLPISAVLTIFIVFLIVYGSYKIIRLILLK